MRGGTSDQIYASIVSTLLALMDGVEGRGQVVVIGATNRCEGGGGGEGRGAEAQAGADGVSRCLLDEAPRRDVHHGEWMVSSHLLPEADPFIAALLSPPAPNPPPSLVMNQA